MKWLALFLAMAVTVQAQRITSGDSTNANGGLVGWWPLCETNGVVFPDLSGNGNHGTNVNGVTLAPGKFGNAGSFNGSSQYVKVPNKAASKLNGAAGGTFAFWMSFPNYTQGNVIRFVTGDSSTGNPGDASGGWQVYYENRNTPGCVLTVQPRALQFDIGTASNNYITRYHTNAVTDAGWHFYACTYSAGTVTIYIDGVSQSVLCGNCCVGGSGNVRDSTVDMNIGSYPPGGGAFMNGQVEWLQIYNRALSASEISAMYFSQRKQFWSAP